MSPDYSSFALFTAGLAAVAPVVNAATLAARAPQVTGNAIIEPGLTDIVPVGEPYTVTWEPTLKTPGGDCGNVVLQLLKGPSTNAIAIQNLTSVYPNNGSYVWTPTTDLPNSSADYPDKGYGLKLICEGSQDYQYSTQFGISNSKVAAGDYTAASSSSTSNASATQTSDSASGTVYTTEVVSQYTTYCPYATQLHYNNKTYAVSIATTLTITDCPCTVTRPVTAGSYGTGVASAGYYPQGNSTVLQPTGGITKPSSLVSSTTAVADATGTEATTTAAATTAAATTTAAASSNGAGKFGASFAGLAIAAGVAVLAL